LIVIIYQQLLIQYKSIGKIDQADSPSMKRVMYLISIRGVLAIPSRKRSQSVATAFYGVLYIRVCQ